MFKPIVTIIRDEWVYEHVKVTLLVHLQNLILVDKGGFIYQLIIRLVLLHYLLHPSQNSLILLFELHSEILVFGCKLRSHHF
jgi:hypothetical protein